MSPRILSVATALLWGVLAVTSDPAAAQRRRVPEIRLEQGRELRMPFASVRSIRELDDGSLLVADGLERSIYRLNRTGTRRSHLGNEVGIRLSYTLPARLLPLAGDSTLLWDESRSEYVIIAPNGAEAARFRLEGDAAHLDEVPPSGTDARGGIYLREKAGALPPTEADPDGSSLRIFRYDRQSGQVQAITRIRTASPPMGPPGVPWAGQTDDTGTVRLPAPTPFQAVDGWGVSPDGRVGVVRADDDRVEWFGPGGAVMSGPTLHSVARPIETGDPQRYLAAWRSERLREGYPIEDVSLVTPNWVDWPDTVPPFPGGIAQVDNWGNLWLPLSHLGDILIRFALIDGQGVKRAEVTLPLHTRLQGFGRESLYLVRVDGVGLEWVQRYQWPVAGARPER